MEQRERLTSLGYPAGNPRHPQAPSSQSTSCSPSSPNQVSSSIQLQSNTVNYQPSHSHQQPQDPNDPSDRRNRTTPTSKTAIRPSESWTTPSPMPYGREPTMGFYHPAPTPSIGVHASQSISATPGLWGDSYTSMAGNPYWYGPPSAQSNSNSENVTHGQAMSVDGSNDGMEHLDVDRHNAGAYHDESYTTSGGGIFLGSMEWSSGQVAPGIDCGVQRRINHHQGGLAPADSNLFSEFPLSSNVPAPGSAAQSYARGLAPQLDDRWQRRGSTGTLSVASDQPRRGQSRSSRRPSAAQEIKTKRELAQKAQRGTTSPHRGGKDASRPADRTTHNDVERKYRMNLKDKIAELRAAIPALQAGSEGEGSDAGTTATGNSKVSKGTVLSKATEYIRELEEMNRNMATEHHHMVQRLHQLESLLQENSSGNAHAASQFQQNQGLGNFDSNAPFE